MHGVLLQILLIKCFENHDLGLCDLLIYTHRYPVLLALLLQFFAPLYV